MGKVTTEEAVRRVRAVHGDKYGTDLVDYKGSLYKIELVCGNHGSFKARLQDITRGTGCPSCARESHSRLVSKDLDTFLHDARKMHGDRYEYITSTYKNYNSNVEIVCKEHGVFLQRANHHVYGHGCPKCQQNGFNCGKQGILYLLSAANGVVKIGITNRDIKSRLWEINKTSGLNFKLITSFSADGQFVYDAEQDILEHFKHLKYDGGVFSGSTECFIPEAFEGILAMFVSYKTACPKVGTVKRRVKKVLNKEQIKLNKRAATELKTGVPTGVVKNQGTWVFQETVRVDGVKTKLIRGRFLDREDAIDFAKHFWETGEEKFTRKNMLYFNKFGYLSGIQPHSGKWQAAKNFRGASGRTYNFYLGFSESPEHLEQEVMWLQLKIKAGVIKIE